MQLSFDEIKELLKGLVPSSGNDSHSFEIGKAYLIRTVTMYYVGRLVSITDADVVLSDAAWVPDTGRFSDALKTGNLCEVEPFVDRVIVMRSGMIDACEWTAKLPRDKK